MLSDVYTEFSKDNFAIRKLEKTFSMIVIHQSHKQIITAIRGDRGAIGLTEDKYKVFFLSHSADTS